MKECDKSNMMGPDLLSTKDEFIGRARSILNADLKIDFILRHAEHGSCYMGLRPVWSAGHTLPVSHTVADSLPRYPYLFVHDADNRLGDLSNRIFHRPPSVCSRHVDTRKP